MSNLITAAALDSGLPFQAILYAPTPGSGGGAQLVANAAGMGPGTSVPYGSGVAGYPIIRGLNTAGMAAVASAVSTYLGDLTSAQAAQLPNAANGAPYVIISFGEVNVPCRQADIASFSATLAAILNETSNYGALGS